MINTGKEIIKKLLNDYLENDEFAKISSNLFERICKIFIPELTKIVEKSDPSLLDKGEFTQVIN